MSTTVFSQKYSDKKGKYQTATVTATDSDGRYDMYRNVWSVVLDCGVYVIYATNHTFTLPATNVELYITTED